MKDSRTESPYLGPSPNHQSAEIMNEGMEMRNEVSSTLSRE